jgi:hypothetical protein
VIRDITADDLGWALSLAHRRYRNFDPGFSLVAMTQAMRSPTSIAWRNDASFLVGHIMTSVWAPKIRGLEVLAICAEEAHPWSAIELLRASVTWAREQGLSKWWLNSDTGYDAAPLAVRVGARLAACYVIDLPGEADAKPILKRIKHSQ